ncbi:MAG: M50 family metallopeptidase [Candidatus Omnitrophota bacterium]
MLKNIFKFLFGLLILPFAIGSTVAFYYNLGRIPRFSGKIHFFSWGIVSYLILHTLIYKPAYLYVLGHESVHAVAAWLCGGKVTSFQVSKDGGKVTTDRTNAFINLSPYFVPIYTVLIAVFYHVISRSYSIKSETFVFLIGFTLAFHIVSTVEALKMKQPDIINTGPLYPIISVYVLNVLIVASLFCFLFPDFTWRGYFRDFYRITAHIYTALFYQLFL